MALRSRTRTATVSSGPGRGPASDGRVRRRRSPVRSRRRQAPADELRRRAQLLFPAHTGERREPGTGPPLPPARRDEREAPPPGESPRSPRSPSAPADRRGRALLAMRERMPLWVQTRCGLERRSVLALSAVLVVAAVLAVQHFWTGRTQTVRAPEVVRAAAPFDERKGRGDAGPSGAPGAAASAAAEIVVDVSGKVREPGIRRLPAGSRVADALSAAGGVRPGTNTDGLNRARLLTDGEQVIVGGPAAPAPVAAGGASSGGAAGGAAAGAAPGAPVALSTATVDQLDTLPGVGPVLARRIVDYRTQHGGFRSVGELREVNGIGAPIVERQPSKGQQSGPRAVLEHRPRA
ncbi:helix-hairpin-helix domain-containing protein [Streptomyces sp. NPDC101225]|uniref:helix-hairpin-helix domain-containing protein n=1 Tax=Streptomyces sp. NPDC101225 TaxID=3366135 RepID=UPI0038221F03